MLLFLSNLHQSLRWGGRSAVGSASGVRAESLFMYSGFCTEEEKWGEICLNVLLVILCIVMTNRWSLMPLPNPPGGLTIWTTQSRQSERPAGSRSWRSPLTAAFRLLLRPSSCLFFHSSSVNRSDSPLCSFVDWWKLLLFFLIRDKYFCIKLLSYKMTEILFVFRGT